MDSILFDAVVGLIAEATTASRSAAAILRASALRGLDRDLAIMELRYAADGVAEAIDLIEGGCLQEAERVAFKAKAAAGVALQRAWFLR
jgi:hypothetical protein